MFNLNEKNFKVLMSFCGETNNTLFNFSKSFPTVILCTVALISLFLCGKPLPPPPFFHTSLLYVPSHAPATPNTVDCGLGCGGTLAFTFKRKHGSLSALQFPHSFPDKEGMTSFLDC